MTHAYSKLRPRGRAVARPRLAILPSAIEHPLPLPVPSPLRPSVAQRCAELGVRLTSKRRQVVELLDQVSTPIDLDEVWWKAGEFGIRINRSSVHRLANDLVAAGVLRALGPNPSDRRVRFATPLVARIELAASGAEPRTIDDPSLAEAIVEALSRHGLSLDGRKITISVA